MPFCVTAHVSFTYFGCSTVVSATTTEPIGSRNCVRFAGSICPQPTKKRAVQNGSRTIMNARRSGPRATFAAPSKLWTSSATRPEPKSSQTAQRNYERYLALARAEAQIGNMVGAENYYGVRSTGTYQVLAREAPRVQSLHTGSSKTCASGRRRTPAW